MTKLIETFKVGDQSKAICDKCGRVVDTIFKTGPYALEKETLPDILQGYCIICGESVALPHQSAVLINRLRTT